MTFVKTALFHKAGEGSGGGGGSGDQHNLGWYATESALTTAHPTANDGDWAIVGATDTVWVWDSDSTEWKDTGQAGIELPDQTGNSGKFLTTDGTDASWSDALVNQNTSIYGIRISNVSAVVNVPSVSVGGYAKATGNYSTAIGPQAETGLNSAHAIVIGNGTVGANASYAKQIGPGTNNDANTMKIGNQNGNFEIMSADGTIPTDRYTTTPSADGTYVPTLTISSGVATRSWGSGGGGSGIQNTATGTDSLTILGTASVYPNSVNIGYQSDASAGASVAIGEEAQAYNNDGSVVVGYNSRAWGGYGVAIGWQAESGASMAIQLGNGTNSDANTFKVGNTNGNFEMMSADGTIPADRLASTTGLADGNYRLRLTMASDVPTLSWVAE